MCEEQKHEPEPGNGGAVIETPAEPEPVADADNVAAELPESVATEGDSAPEADTGEAVAAETPPADVSDEETAPEDEAVPVDTADREAGSDEQASAEITTESVVEAILFATDSPIPAAKIARILEVGDARSVKKQIAALNEKYEQLGASFRIEELAGGFQMLTLPAYNNWIGKLHAVRRETKLSPAALETLAVVAYKQPVIRADVESVRGVAVGEVLNRLREMGLVKIVGRAEVVGRPMLYGTTRKFLQTFGLASLDDLPKVDALSLPPSRGTPAEAAEGANGEAEAETTTAEEPAGDDAPAEPEPADGSDATPLEEPQVETPE